MSHNGSTPPPDGSPDVFSCETARRFFGPDLDRAARIYHSAQSGTPPSPEDIRFVYNFNNRVRARVALCIVEKMTGMRPTHACAVQCDTSPASDEFLSTPDSASPYMYSDSDMRLTDVRVDGHERAFAQTDLFRTSWSSEFVHGPDTLLPLAALAEKVLRPDERLTALRRISWRQPVTHNMDIAVLSGDFSSFRDPRSAVDGVFETNQGRPLSFFGAIRPGAIIQRDTCRNPLADSMTCLCDKHGPQKISPDSYQATLFLGMDIGALRSAPVAFATYTELITICLSSVFDDICDGSRIALMGGVNNLTLPPDPVAPFRDTDPFFLTLRRSEARTGRSGMHLLPFSYRFPHQTDLDMPTGVVAYMEK